MIVDTIPMMIEKKKKMKITSALIAAIIAITV
jgi:hypothetical protein